MEITQEAKVALWGSIQKWGKIATAFRIAERDGSDPVYEENGLHDCPLCLKYNNPGRTLNACGGCPIAEDTNDCGCDGTPYEKWGADFGDSLENAEAMLAYPVDLNNRCEVES